MDDEADQHESDQEELVKQQVRCHDDVPFHGDERRRLYRIHPLSNYPLDCRYTTGQSAPTPFVVTEMEHGNLVRLPQGKASRKASR